MGFFVELCPLPWTGLHRGLRRRVWTDLSWQQKAGLQSSSYSHEDQHALSSRQNVQAALEIFSRMSRNGSVVCMLKFIDPVI